MTSVNLSEPGQPEMDDALAALLANLATAAQQGAADEAVATRSLAQEIAAVVAEFKAENKYGMQVATALEAFGYRLATGGFVRSKDTPDSVSVQVTADRYTVWARQHWLHPECDVPFHADLTLHVRTSSDRQGEVFVELELMDSETHDDTYGVLTGKPFLERFVLQPSAVFGSASFWKHWVCMGLEQLQPETFEDLFDRALAHLEKVTSA